jgi:aspartate/methionine/tyrosine aminotransferase
VLVVHGSGFGSDPRAGYFRMVYLADAGLLGSAFDAIEQSLPVLV